MRLRADALDTKRAKRTQLVEARRLYRAAFRAGDQVAGINLAVSYQQTGEVRAAYQWYVRVLETDDRSVLLEIAKAELYGRGARRNIPRALARLQQIVRDRRGRWTTQFDREQAMVILGRTYLEGWLVGRDWPRARRWLQRAERLGSEEAAGLLRDIG